MSAAEEIETIPPKSAPKARPIGSEKPRERGLHVEYDVFAPLPPRKYTVAPLNLSPGAPNGCFSFSWGGKTIVHQDMMLSMALDERIFGQFAPTKGLRVVHVDHEQGRHETFDRYQRLARARGLTESDLQDLMASKRLGVVTLPDVYLNSDDARRQYTKLAGLADVIIIDALAAAQKGLDENALEFSAPLYMLGELSNATGVMFYVLGHTGKGDLAFDGAEKEQRGAPRGHSSIIGAMGTVFKLSGGKGEPKRVTMAKGRSLGGVQVEDFYLSLEPVTIDGYINPGNPDDPGGFRIVYKTVEQAKEGTAARASDALIRRVVAAVHRHGGPSGLGVTELRGAMRVAKDRIGNDELSSGVGAARSRGYLVADSRGKLSVTIDGLNYLSGPSADRPGRDED